MTGINIAIRKEVRNSNNYLNENPRGDKMQETELSYKSKQSHLQ